MSEFIQETVTDLRRGRESWRVHLLLAIPSFLLAMGLALASRPW